MALEPYQQRVVAELEELHSKVLKLQRFVNGPNLAAVAWAEQGRLWRQLAYMEAYASTLADRIRSFPGAPPAALSVRVVE